MLSRVAGARETAVPGRRHGRAGGEHVSAVACILISYQFDRTCDPGKQGRYRDMRPLVTGQEGTDAVGQSYIPRRTC